MWEFFVAAGVGSAAQEILHWYDMRGKLGSKRLRALMSSKGYWVITVLVIVISPLCAWFLVGPATRQTAFLAGAAFPLIFKKSVSAFAEKDQENLGTAGLRDYFLLFSTPGG